MSENKKNKRQQVKLRDYCIHPKFKQEVTPAKQQDILEHSCRDIATKVLFGHFQSTIVVLPTLVETSPNTNMSNLNTQ